MAAVLQRTLQADRPWRLDQREARHPGQGDVGLGNGRQAGGGQALCPEALVDDGLLDLTIVPELSGEVAATLGTLGVPPGGVDRHRVFWRTPTGVFSVTLPIDGSGARAACETNMVEFPPRLAETGENRKRGGKAPGHDEAKAKIA